MAASGYLIRSPLSLLAIACPLPPVLASPVHRISSPEMGTLSFSELAEQTVRRILELGFTRGILSSLLILGSLVCLLICALAGLGAYLRRHDTYLSEKARMRDRYEGKQQEMKSNIFATCQFRPRTRTRLSRYIFTGPSSPVTRINIHASSIPRKIVTTPLSTPSKLPNISTRVSSSPQTSPLRSALSKSTRPRVSRTHSFFFPSRRRSSPVSPKSVRWADQIAVSVTATVEMSVRGGDGEKEQATLDAEMDIGSQTVGEKEPRAVLVDVTLDQLASELRARDRGEITRRMRVDDDDDNVNNTQTSDSQKQQSPIVVLFKDKIDW